MRSVTEKDAKLRDQEMSAALRWSIAAAGILMTAQSITKILMRFVYDPEGED